MREIGLYVGKKTAMAATARGEVLRRKMESGPLGRLMAVAQMITGFIPDGQAKPDKDHEQWCRGVLRGLGYDPDTHLLSRRGEALIVRDFVGDPQKAYRPKTLKALSKDRAFMAGFAEEAR